VEAVAARAGEAALERAPEDFAFVQNVVSEQLINWETPVMNSNAPIAERL
jgi:hypothetical protein